MKKKRIKKMSPAKALKKGILRSVCDCQECQKRKK